MHVLKNVEEAFAELRRDGSRPVRARVGDMTVEIHVVPDASSGKTAAELFRDIGPWDGESEEEIAELLAEARRGGGRREVPPL